MQWVHWSVKMINSRINIVHIFTLPMTYLLEFQFSAMPDPWYVILKSRPRESTGGEVRIGWHFMIAVTVDKQNMSRDFQT